MSQTIVTEWTPCWKLTDQKNQTRGGTQWGESITNPHGIKTGDGGLCSGGFYHGYTSQYLAVLMNPCHANIAHPVLWAAEYRGTVEDDRGLKFGATELRTVCMVKAPVITTVQRQAFAIWCAALVLDESDSRNELWFVWAAKWLNGEDRSASASSSSSSAAAAAATWASSSAAWSSSSAADMLETVISCALLVEEAQS